MASDKTSVIWKIKQKPDKHILVIIFVIALTVFPLWMGKFYVLGDMQTVHIPLEQFFQKEQLQWQIPAWNPDVAWGFPVVASAQIGFFYPPLLIARGILPISMYLPLILIAHVIMAALGMYYFLKQIHVSATASYIGAISYALSAFLWQHLSQLNVFLAFSYLPWQLYLTHIVAHKKIVKAKHIAALSLLYAAPFLIGQLQIPLLMTIICSLYFLTLTGWTSNALKRTIPALLIVAIGAIAISSVQLIPTLELFKFSSRSNEGSFDTTQANQHSYPLYHIPTMIFPRFYNTDGDYWGKRLEVEYGFYIGAIPLIFAGWAVRQYIKKKPITIPRTDRNTTFFLWLLIISFLLSLGNLSPFRLIGFEPSLWVFTGPARWLLFSTISLSFLAAKGFDLLSGDQKIKIFRKYTGWIALILFICVVIANILLHQIPLETIINLKSEFATNKIASLLESARTSSVSLTSVYTYINLIPVLSLPFLLGIKHARKVILIITTVELILIAGTANPVISWNKVIAVPEVIQSLPENIKEKNARIYTVQEGGDTGAYFTNPQSRGGEKTREQYRQLLAPMMNSTHNIAGIEWPASLIFKEQEEALDNLRTNESYEITNQELAADLNIGALLRIVSDKVEVESYPTKPRAEILGKDGVSIGKATYKEISSNHAEVTVDTPISAKLITRDTYFPGWRATINGQDTSIHRTKGFFRSVDVPAGHHVIEFKYYPKSIYIGLAISTIAILAAIAVIFQSPRHAVLEGK